MLPSAPSIAQILPYLQLLQQLLGGGNRGSIQPPLPAAPMTPQQIGNMMQPQINQANIPGADPRYSTPQPPDNPDPNIYGKPAGLNTTAKARIVKPPWTNRQGKKLGLTIDQDNKRYSGTVK